MPTSTPNQARDTEVAIRAVVTRLARPDGKGGAVIERAAILAEGTSAGAIIEWLLAHGGVPEITRKAAPTGGGLYGPRASRFSSASGPGRYVIPVAALEEGSS